MANIRVKDLPNTNTAADTDEFIIDSSTAGTRRLSYSELKSEISTDFAADVATYGIATLDSDNKLTASQIPDSLAQGMNFVGVANSAGDLTSTTQGDFYVIQTAFGSYNVGDQAVFDGSAYVRVVDGTKEISEGGTGATTLDDAKGNLEVPDVGTDPSQVPLNQHLGSMAYQSSEGISVGTVEADEIGVGVTDPDELIHAKATSSAVYFKSESGSTVGVFGASNTAGAAVSGSTTASDYQLWSANQLRWTISGSTGNLVANSTGIDFGSTSSGFGTPSGGLLNDYEEGTFTIGTAGDATGAISHQYGQYVKVGRVVTVRLTFRVSANFTGNRIDGLPFNAQCPNTGSLSGIGGGFVAMTSNVNASPIFAINTHGTDEISFMSGTSTGALHVINTTNSIYRITATYETTI